MCEKIDEKTATASEIARFEALADEWWDKSGPFAPLHRLNPVRIAFLRRSFSHPFGSSDPDAPFAGLSALDIGCGGGLFAEALARLGFAVTAIDAGKKNIKAARLHAERQGLSIDYRCALPEELGERFDLVATMEVIEHVPSPSAFVKASLNRLKPGGGFIAATLNRTMKSWLLAIVGAERVLRWTPPGTHQWKQFVRPSEFAALLREEGIRRPSFQGVRYDLASNDWVETRDLDVNYMAFGIKEQ